MSFFGRVTGHHFRVFLLSGLASVSFVIPQFALAGFLTQVSDTITDSAPSSTTTSHTIRFISSSGIPASGSIVITPEARSGSSFNIPPALNFSDMNLAVSIGAGPYIDRTLALLPSAVNDGVAVVSGLAGTITITLASGIPIPAGAAVEVRIGNSAHITSPGATISYRIRLATKDATSVILDSSTAMIAIVDQVGVSAKIEQIMAILSNGLPTGLLPGSTSNVLVSFNTDIPATCKYSSTSSTTYASMLGSTFFTDANGSLLHFQPFTTATNTIYRFYVRCETISSFAANDTDYLITFEIGVVPNASSTPLPPPPPPPPPGPSGGGGGGGSGGNFLKGGDVTLDGITIPQGSLVITQDGVIIKQEVVSSLGTFTDLFSNLQRGTYTYGVYVKDANGNRSSTYSSTIYLIGGTNNIIAPIYLSPTIVAASTTVAIGGDIEVSGFGIPLKKVLGVINKQGNTQAGILTASTTANGNGSWKLKFSTDGLTKGTYLVKVQTLVSQKDQSIFSPVLYIGVGENPNPDFKNRADLNKDGKVNLVDFSILLFNWKGSDAVADINQDGIVNLTDFSIMLANWTG